MNGIYINENIEAKTSFVGFPLNEKGSGQATTLNFEDHLAVVTFCKLVLKVDVADNSEMTTNEIDHLNVSDGVVLSVSVR